MIIVRKFFGLLIFISISQFAFAQDNKEESNAAELKLMLNGSARIIDGAFSQSLFAAGLDITFLKSSWDIHNVTNYQYLKNGDFKLSDNWYDLLTVSYYINNQKRIYPLGFYHFDNNLMFRVEHRHRYGLGLSSLITESENHSLRLAAGVGYEQSLFASDIFENSELVNSMRNNGLFLARGTGEVSFAEKKVNLSATLFYMHSTKESKDYRIWVLPKISLKVSKQFRINASYDYRFENVHLVGLSEFNSTLLFGLSFSASNRS